MRHKGQAVFPFIFSPSSRGAVFPKARKPRRLSQREAPTQKF
jgi:hypothetical protein